MQTKAKHGLKAAMALPLYSPKGQSPMGLLGEEANVLQSENSGLSATCEDFDWQAPAGFGSLAGAWTGNCRYQLSDSSCAVDRVAKDTDGNFIAGFQQGAHWKMAKFSASGHPVPHSGRYYLGSVPVDASAMVQHYLSASYGYYYFVKGASFACAHIICSYSLDACRNHAQTAGLQLGGSGYPFARKYSETGCFAYSNGTWANMAFYGYLIDNSEISAAHDLTAITQSHDTQAGQKYRLDTCPTTTTTTTTRKTTTTTTTMTTTLEPWQLNFNEYAHERAASWWLDCSQEGVQHLTPRSNYGEFECVTKDEWDDVMRCFFRSEPDDCSRFTYWTPYYVVPWRLCQGVTPPFDSNEKVFPFAQSYFQCVQPPCKYVAHAYTNDVPLWMNGTCNLNNPFTAGYWQVVPDWTHPDEAVFLTFGSLDAAGGFALSGHTVNSSHMKFRLTACNVGNMTCAIGETAVTPSNSYYSILIASEIPWTSSVKLWLNGFQEVMLDLPSGFGKHIFGSPTSPTCSSLVHGNLQVRTFDYMLLPPYP